MCNKHSSITYASVFIDLLAPVLIARTTQTDISGTLQYVCVLNNKIILEYNCANLVGRSNLEHSLEYPHRS